MAYNVAGLNAQGAGHTAALFLDFSHLGRQTAGENNPRLTPYDLRCEFSFRLKLRSARRKSSLHDLFSEGHARIIGRPGTGSGSN
jgi:hypothetical protein